MSRCRAAIVCLVATSLSGCVLTESVPLLRDRTGRRAQSRPEFARGDRSVRPAAAEFTESDPLDDGLEPAAFPLRRRPRTERPAVCPPEFVSGPEIRGGGAGTTSTGMIVPAPLAGSPTDQQGSTGAGNPAVDREPARGEPVKPKAPVKLNPDQELRKGDRLAVRYLTTVPENASYALMPGDIVRVEYLHLLHEDPETGSGRPSTLDREIRVGPDGRLTLPHLKSFNAAGKTIDGLRDFLNEQYKDLYVEPNLHVSLVRGGVMLDELRRASGTDEVQVGDDGRIRLERLGMSQTAVAFTVGDLEKEINERLRARLPGLAVRFQTPDGE